VDALARIIAPILSFTSEEVWTHLKGKVESLPESVHLSPYPTSNPQYFLKKEEYDDFKRLIHIREDVLLKIEEMREKRVIGSSLEARVRIEAYGKDLEILSKSKEELPSIFIVSQVELLEGKELRIKIEKAKGGKCIRCWNFSEGVGKDPTHPEICSRCIKIINKEVGDGKE
jgi:isoleucyl-tRNA synthetase